MVALSEVPVWPLRTAFMSSTSARMMYRSSYHVERTPTSDEACSFRA